MADALATFTIEEIRELVEEMEVELRSLHQSRLKRTLTSGALSKTTR